MVLRSKQEVEVTHRLRSLDEPGGQEDQSLSPKAVAKQRKAQQNRSWARRNRVRVLEYSRRYRSKHLEKCRASSRKYFLANKVSHQRKRVEFNRRVKTEMISAYGGKCACCGETAYEFLTIDHINGGGSKARRQGGPVGNYLYLWLKRHGWPKDNYRLLCMNCNFAMGIFGGCPHEKTRDAPKL